MGYAPPEAVQVLGGDLKDISKYIRKGEERHAERITLVQGSCNSRADVISLSGELFWACHKDFFGTYP